MSRTSIRLIRPWPWGRQDGLVVLDHGAEKIDVVLHKGIGPHDSVGDTAGYQRLIDSAMHLSQFKVVGIRPPSPMIGEYIGLPAFPGGLDDPPPNPPWVPPGAGGGTVYRPRRRRFPAFRVERS